MGNNEIKKYGHQPSKDSFQRGYQPAASSEPEGQKPPTGGSNVAPPPAQSVEQAKPHNSDGQSDGDRQKPK